VAVTAFAGAVHLGIERATPVEFADLQVRSMWRLLGAILAAFAYGPLEVFFVMWLIRNSDRVLKSERPTLSRGLVVTVLIYGIPHTFSQGLYAIVLTARYFALGWIYESTRNAIAQCSPGL
jgi:membrane protease YdiL (CAAX protease family)